MEVEEGKVRRGREGDMKILGDVEGKSYRRDFSKGRSVIIPKRLRGQEEFSLK